jgi:hypothetical protein
MIGVTVVIYVQQGFFPASACPVCLYMKMFKPAAHLACHSSLQALYDFCKMKM